MALLQPPVWHGPPGDAAGGLPAAVPSPRQLARAVGAGARPAASKEATPAERLLPGAGPPAELHPPLAPSPALCQSLKRARRVEYKAGAVILDTDASHTTLVLLMEGLATFTFSNRDVGWSGPAPGPGGG